MEHMGYSFSAIITCAALKTPMMVVYSGIILLIHRGCVAIGNQDILRSPVSIQYLGVCSLWLLLYTFQKFDYVYLSDLVSHHAERSPVYRKMCQFYKVLPTGYKLLGNLMNCGYIYHKPKFTQSPAPT
jgi:hypothetical protein